MNTLGRSLIVALLFVLAAAVWASGCRQRHDQRVDLAAAALFDEFETVAGADVSRLAFEVIGRQEPDPRQMLFMPFGYLFAALNTLGDSTSEGVASETVVMLAGMKDFRGPSGPTGLGSVSSRNCYVLLVKPGFDLARSLGRGPTTQMNGAPIWEWSGHIHEYGDGDDRPSTFFALQIKPSYVLVSNDARSLRRVADALDDRTGPERVLAGLSEWKDVSPSSYWVYRRYRFAEVVDPLAAATDRVRKDAESLVFFTKPGRQTAILRLVSTQQVATAPEDLLGDARLPPLAPVTSRSWEASLSLSGGYEQWETMFIVMSYMGFAVYL